MLGLVPLLSSVNSVAGSKDVLSSLWCADLDTHSGQSGSYSPSIHLLEELPIHLHSDYTHLHASPQWIWVPPPPQSCFLFLLMSLLTVMRWHFKVVLIYISWVSLINLWAWSCHFWLCSLEVWKEGWLVCSQSVHSLLLKVLSLA